MKNHPLWLTLGLLGLSVLSTSCSTLNKTLGGNSPQEALANTTWDYSANALQLSLDADNALNYYEGEAHSVVLAIVQTADPAAFYSQLQNPESLEHLLQTGQATTGLLQVTRYAIEPGRHTLVQLDRAQAARYVGVIVGYYGVPLASTAKLFNLPVTIEKNGFFVNHYSAHVAAATLQLTLGVNAIINANIGTSAAVLPRTGEVPPPPSNGILLLNDLNPTQ